MNAERLISVFRQKNIRTYFSLSVFLFLYLSFSACERRELTYSDEAEITVTADWSKAGLSDKEQEYGATTVFYPTDGSTPIVALMGDRTQKTMRLKKGRYDVVLFNRSFDDFGYLGFRGAESYRTLEAHVRNIEARSDPSSGKVVTDNPDELAAGCLEGFEVTPGMLGNYSPATAKQSSRSATGEKDGCLLRFVPQKLTRQITVRIRIKGMNNIRNATCRLGGVAESVFLVSGKAAEKTVTHEFELGSPLYDSGSLTEGILSAVIGVFGFDEDIPHNLHLEALLVDGKTTFEENFSGVEVSRVEEGDGTVSIVIDTTCEQTVPYVKAEGSSGFDANVDHWEDEGNSDIDI